MSFHVSFNDSTRARLSVLKENLLPLGLGPELARVLTELLNDLQQRPLEAGEVMYHLYHVPMQVKVLVKEYLCAVFVVHEESKSVMVTKITMLEENPFPKGYAAFLNE